MVEPITLSLLVDAVVDVVAELAGLLGRPDSFAEPRHRKLVFNEVDDARAARGDHPDDQLPAGLGKVAILAENLRLQPVGAPDALY